MRARRSSVPTGKTAVLQGNVMRARHGNLRPDVLLMNDPAKTRLWMLVTALSFIFAAAIWWQHAYP